LLGWKLSVILRHCLACGTARAVFWTHERGTRIRSHMRVALRYAYRMEVRLIEDRLLWNTFIAATSTGHLCQTYEWPDNSGDLAGAGALRIGVLENGRMVAAMLLVRSQASGIRLPFFYVPRGPVCADPHSPGFPN